LTLSPSVIFGYLLKSPFGGEGWIVSVDDLEARQRERKIERERERERESGGVVIREKLWIQSLPVVGDGVYAYWLLRLD
jgi:hypothetical protein